MMKATGPWNVDAADDLCLLAHNFGTGDQTAILGFQPIFNDDTMELIVLTTDTVKMQRIGKAKISSNRLPKPIEAPYASVGSSTKPQRLTRITVNRSVFDELGATSYLTITAAPVNMTFLISKSDKAMVAFKTCETELLKTWGVETLVDKDHAAKPINNINSFFNATSYPDAARDAGVYGRVVALLNLAADGAIGGCHVVRSAAKELNEATCENARKIRFRPAIGPDGKPIASIYPIAVSWELPGL